MISLEEINLQQLTMMNWMKDQLQVLYAFSFLHLDRAQLKVGKITGFKTINILNHKYIQFSSIQIVITIKSLPPSCPIPISVSIPPGTYELPRVQRNNRCSWSRSPRHWIKRVHILYIKYHWLALHHPSLARIWTQLVGWLVHVGRNHWNRSLFFGFVLVLYPVALHPLDYMVYKWRQRHPCSQWVNSVFNEGY